MKNNKDFTFFALMFGTIIILMVLLSIGIGVSHMVREIPATDIQCDKARVLKLIPEPSSWSVNPKR
jgi:hypothetical protein